MKKNNDQPNLMDISLKRSEEAKEYRMMREIHIKAWLFVPSFHCTVNYKFSDIVATSQYTLSIIGISNSIMRRKQKRNETKNRN